MWKEVNAAGPRLTTGACGKRGGAELPKTRQKKKGALS